VRQLPARMGDRQPPDYTTGNRKQYDATEGYIGDCRYEGE